MLLSLQIGFNFLRAATLSGCHLRCFSLFLSSLHWSRSYTLCRFCRDFLLGLLALDSADVGGTFTQDSKVEYIFCGASYGSEPSLFFSNYFFSLGLEPIQDDDIQHDFA